jgi:excinuclease ABC subunit A
VPAVESVLRLLSGVGLGYLRLGQPLHTLSGGEAQRVKLASVLGQRHRDPTLFLLDEPTTGLHIDDVAKLIAVFDKLLALGHTLLVIEHNLELIRDADYVIDLGPEGGPRGGRIVAVGTPEELSRIEKSATGERLAATFDTGRKRRAVSQEAAG